MALKLLHFFAGTLLLVNLQAFAQCLSCSADFVCLDTKPATHCPDQKTCILHDKNCGNVLAQVEKLPQRKPVTTPAATPVSSAAKPVVTELQSTTPAQFCKPAIIGPALRAENAKHIANKADNNWLLTMALIKFHQRMQKGIPDSLVIGFPLAETEQRQNQVLADKPLNFPDEQQGANGFMSVKVWAKNPEQPFPEQARQLKVELHIWRIASDRMLPTHGMQALLLYVKDEAGNWVWRGMHKKYAMPRPNPQVFAELEGNPELLAFLHSLGPQQP